MDCISACLSPDIPLYTAFQWFVFICFFLTYPKCTAAPMMHLCLLFMLMRLNPIGPLPSCARCLLIKTQSAVKSLKRPLEATFDLVLWPFTFLLGMLLYCSVLTTEERSFASIVLLLSVYLMPLLCSVLPCRVINWLRWAYWADV